ncbi:hypothetical protein PAE9249_00486 [Paenibacillus sp. CECT 9249]|nr:hypothetical protein PAE9249_00486 [Paenibacillus sp. CECT 9249]
MNVLKINDIGRLGALNQYMRNIESREGNLGKKGLQRDKVSISSEAKEMLDAQSRVKDPERAQRIEQLKEAVATGTYYVDADKIAEKLLPYFKQTPGK